MSDLDPALLADAPPGRAPVSPTLQRVIAAARRMNRALVHVDPATDAPEMAADFEDLAERLEALGTMEVRQTELNRRTRNPATGSMNPIAPPITVDIVDNIVLSTVSFSEAYQGPPGTVHGGWVAALLDETMGRTRLLVDNNVVTGSLHVRYVAPTPINTDLVGRAWIVDRQTKKMIVYGEIRAGETVTATAEGVFVYIARERFVSLGNTDNPEVGP